MIDLSYAYIKCSTPQHHHHHRHHTNVWNIALSSTASAYSSPPRYEFRNMQLTDIDNAAELCCEVFDGPFNTWIEKLSKSQKVGGHKQQLTRRFQDNVLAGNNKNHAMIIVVDNNTNKKDIVGFLEVGLLPSPVPLNTTWNDVTVESIVDVPYLGNVIVREDSRRQGIGSKLVKIGLKIAEKWNEGYLYLAVDNDNIKAQQLYQKLGFITVLDETLLINRKLNRTPRLFMKKSSSSTSTT